MNGLNNSFKIARVNILHFQLPYFLLAILFMGTMIVLFGVVGLGELAINTILGRFIPLLGLLLLPPLVIHELSEEISDVVYTKRVAHWHVICLRILTSLMYLTILLGGYVAFLEMNGSVITLVQLLYGFINILFLGSVGFLGIILFKNVTIGYMLAIIYYLSNFFIPKELGVFYLFDMTSSKVPLLLSGAVCLVFGMYWQLKRNNRR